MSKHTPGPWKLDERMGVCTYVTGGHDGRRGICSTGGYSTNSVDPVVLNDENIANARLIAAAPDLLEALETILMMIPPTALVTSQDSVRLENVAKVAHEAITRAEATS